MARKKRLVEQPALPTNEPKEKVAYQDAFQSNVNRRLEESSKAFEGKGKTILYAIAAIAVLAVLIGIFMSYNRRSNAAAQTALGKAIETSQAQVTDQPLPAGSTMKSFKTEKERAEASIAEFQAVADKFGGDVGEKAKYFIAVNRLSVDRPAAVTELEGLAKGSGEVGTLSKFALAQAKTSDGKLDEAVTIYQDLAKMSDPIIAKDTINFNLAQILEKQGKKAEAADLYYNIAKTAAEAKDADGKAIPLSLTAREAKDKLTALDPEKAKTIPEPTPEAPSGLNFGQ
ncbi:tetratricopeptide repeat protein [Biomphalaria pfeifferi]|uniref:Tetratricopeptide repeat protein n=1 Tax=Biomphalaria pfeifferi TaxID=112525 RepID=A0AAD8ANC1_BIOPF|nr:tetratricopeptide repeat protein [Biomphalaria pfeifferi]